MGRKGLQTLTYRESTVPLELWRHPFVQGSCREGQDSDVESQRILPIGKNQTRMSLIEQHVTTRQGIICLEIWQVTKLGHIHLLLILKSNAKIEKKKEFQALQ